MPAPTPEEIEAKAAAIAEARRLLDAARDRLRRAWGVKEHQRALADIAAAAVMLDRALGMRG